MIDFIGIPMRIFYCTHSRRNDPGRRRSNEYTLQKEKKSEDYTIIKTEGSTAYIALILCRSIQILNLKHMKTAESHDYK